MKRYLKRDALIPRLARDLARQLVEGHEADPALADAVRVVQALYKSKFEPITTEQFENTLRLVARGARTQCFSWGVAVEGSDISPASLRKYLADPELRRLFAEARRHWKQYREWGVLEIEELLDELARGDRSLQSICYAHGWDRNKYLRILYLIARAPEVEARYHRAKLTQQARISDRLFEEAGEVSTREEARELSRRMDLLRRRMPRKICEVFHRDRTPIELARRRAGLRMNGKKREPEGTT